MQPDIVPNPSRPSMPPDGFALITQAMLALRSTGDLGTASAIAGSCVMSALEASDYRLLRVDARSGTLRCLDGTGVEMPYLPEEGGPVEWVQRNGQPCWQEEPADRPESREAGLWIAPPVSLATLPLLSGNAVCGLLLVGFDVPRYFTPAERLFLQALGDGLALAFERSDLRHQLEEERRRVAELEKRQSVDEETSAHLMSVVAHEIRSPLTAIKAYTEAMLDNLSNPHAPRERFLGIISDECDRLTRLVTDVLDLSRLEAGQRPLRLARTSIDAMLRDAVQALAAPAKARQVRVVIDSENGLVAEVDPDLMRRLLAGLIGNAVRCSPTSGSVRVKAFAQGEEWRATVEDDGPGFPREDLPHVFERFYRPRTSGEGEAEGDGLALAISRGIVELHGGRIGVQPLSPHGTRFTFALPMRQLASPRARRIARQVWGRGDLRELLDATVDMIAATMDAEIVSFMLVDPDHGDLFIAASRGLEGQNLLGRRTTLRSGVAGSVAAWGRPLLVSNIETDRRFSRLNHPQYRTKSLVCSPVRIEGEVLGVVNVNNKNSGEAFDEDDLVVITALIERVGSAIERACAHPESERVVADAVLAIRSIARLHRDMLLGGGHHVHLTRATARELGLSDPDVDLIGYVASVHDLGMERIRPQVTRPVAFAPEERGVLASHPEMSVEIIRPLEYLGTVREIILSHHERWDGRGYPRGLKGDEIAIGARILAVVDAWESMLCGRPWRPARRPSEALEELSREAGQQFDPTVVEAFVRVAQREAES